jgi:large subunit ribosomal protein L4
VRWQLSKRRTTAYRAKTYSEKSGSGRKPFRQKGTGSARQGNKRAPIQRGGLKAHGPKLRDWSHKLNKEVRRKGLRVALSAKLRDNKVSFITGVEAFASAKTADLQRRLQAAVEGHKIATAQEDAETDAPAAAAGTAEEGASSPVYGAAGSALVVVDPSERTEQIEAASRSLNHMVLVSQLGCTVYDVLRADRLILTTKALEAIEARLTN